MALIWPMYQNVLRTETLGPWFVRIVRGNEGGSVEVLLQIDSEQVSSLLWLRTYERVRGGNLNWAPPLYGP
ncbi:hypothetical protein Y032_0042g603 [Ancylostoma ceylanicum]|uniref:Uncharacterized protein n=1 Tax=Ancylostoma ceylanicum TaxID=53326 RepID=A0A016UF35_9BILA|nr:hypothetical protein Y032_0042g603 [Ancylostoma ceylanicum]